MLKQYHIIECKPLPGFKLFLKFADGVSGAVDVSHLVGKGVFKHLTDPQEFAKVQIDPVTHTVCWDGELDLDPLKLHDNIVQQSRH